VRLSNLTYLFIKFLKVKMNPLNTVSHNLEVHNNVLSRVCVTIDRVLIGDWMY
jgi:hypothetical protein